MGAAMRALESQIVLSDPGGDHLRWVSPARLADLAVFLVSDAAAEITGAAIPVYGARI